MFKINKPRICLATEIHHLYLENFVECFQCILFHVEYSITQGQLVTKENHGGNVGI